MPSSARHKTSAASSTPRRRALTLIELLVLMAVFAVVFSILVPAMSGGHNQAMATKCQANLRQIGVCTLMYMQNQQGRRLIPWYQYPAHEGYNITLFTTYVFGGFKAPRPAEDWSQYSMDCVEYPAEIRPLNTIAYPEARGNNTIDLYICPADKTHSTSVIGQAWHPDFQEMLSSWEANGSSYSLNTRWAQGYSWPSGNFSLNDFRAETGTFPHRIAKHMLGGEASAFIMWGEQAFYAATYAAGPTIDGIGGGSSPRRYGWHRKFSNWTVGFADGHVGYGYFDTRQIYGLGGTIWQPNFDPEG